MDLSEYIKALEAWLFIEQDATYDCLRRVILFRDKLIAILPDSQFFMWENGQWKQHAYTETSGD